MQTKKTQKWQVKRQSCTSGILNKTANVRSPTRGLTWQHGLHASITGTPYHEQHVELLVKVSNPPVKQHRERGRQKWDKKKEDSLGLESHERWGVWVSHWPTYQFGQLDIDREKKIGIGGFLGFEGVSNEPLYIFRRVTDGCAFGQLHLHQQTHH